jgi:virginiamycin B lyase
VHLVFARRLGVAVLSLAVVGGAFMAGGPAGPQRAAAATGALTSYAATGARTVNGLALSDDGKLWFVATGSSTAGYIAPSGTVSGLTLPSLINPGGIVQGADGLMWLTTANDELISINPQTLSVSATSGTNPGDISTPTAIAVGPDGGLWWTNSDNHSIGHRAPDGTTTHYADPGIDDPAGIAADLGGMWFTSRANNTIGYIALDGTITLHTSPNIATPSSIALGPDGNMWFTNATWIGRVTTDGTATITKYAPAAITAPRQITAGPDGGMWVTNGAGNSLVRLSTTGTATAYTGSTYNNPYAVTFGTDNAIWFSAVNNGTADSRIVRFTTGAAIGATRPFVVPGTPTIIVKGADSALWFAGGTGRISRMTATGAFRSVDGLEYTPAALANGKGSDHAVWGADATLDHAPGYDAVGAGLSANNHPNTPIGAQSLIIGPDGHEWFAVEGAIKRFDHGTGTTTTFADARIKSPVAITAGPDGALWFVNKTGNSIGRITMAGALKFYTNTLVKSPTSIVKGADGALWFTSSANQRIGRLTTAGAFKFYTSSAVLTPTQIAAGPDSALWFTLGASNRIGRITTAGVISTYAMPFHAALGIRGRSLVAGTDGAMWVATGHPGVILRINATHDTVAPVSSAPKAAPAPSTAWEGSVPVTSVTVAATDAGRSGIDHYELQIQTDGKAWTWVNSNLRTTAVKLSLANSHTYRFRARAVDKAGNVGAFATGPVYKQFLSQETSKAAVYSTGWAVDSSPADSGGAAKYASAAGKAVTFSFVGRAFAWVSTTGPTRGQAKVYVDGVLVKTVDLSAVSETARVQVYTRTWTTSAAHKVKLVVVGTVGHPRVDVDAFVTFQ